MTGPEQQRRHRRTVFRARLRLGAILIVEAFVLVIVGADRSWQAWLVMLATVALTLGCWVTWGTRDGQWPRAAGMTWLVKIGGVAMLGVLADSPWWASLVYGSIWASIVLIPTGIASTVAREVA